MKTRNWKLCTLAIFLAVCFTLYADHCYPQELWTSQVLDLPIYRPSPDPWPGPWPGPDPWPSPYPQPNFDWTFFDFWTPPAGQTTLDLLQDLMPGRNLNRDTFYKTDYFSSIDNLYDDYYGLPGPTMDNWNLYQRTDLYVRPKAGEHNLYQFTQDFLVQPRQPDVYTAYGMGGGYAGLGGYGMGGFGLGALGGLGGGYGMSAGYGGPMAGF